MKARTSIGALILLTLPLFAHASCEAVKSRINEKLQANGVSHYGLDIVAADQADTSGGKVVGQCESNKVIVYTREPSAASNNAPAAKPVPTVAKGQSDQTGG